MDFILYEDNYRFVWYDFGALVGFNLFTERSKAVSVHQDCSCVVSCYHYYLEVVDFDSVLVPAKANNYLHYGNYYRACIWKCISVGDLATFIHDSACTAVCSMNPHTMCKI